MDIPLVSETKLDYTFPKSQFFVQGYSTPFRERTVPQKEVVYFCMTEKVSLAK